MKIFNKWILAAATNAKLNKKAKDISGKSNALDIDFDITTQLNKLLEEQKDRGGNIDNIQ